MAQRTMSEEEALRIFKEVDETILSWEKGDGSDYDAIEHYETEIAKCEAELEFLRSRMELGKQGIEFWRQGSYRRALEDLENGRVIGGNLGTVAEDAVEALEDPVNAVKVSYIMWDGEYGYTNHAYVIAESFEDAVEYVRNSIEGGDEDFWGTDPAFDYSMPDSDGKNIYCAYGMELNEDYDPATDDEDEEYTTLTRCLELQPESAEWSSLKGVREEKIFEVDYD